MDAAATVSNTRRLVNNRSDDFASWLAKRGLGDYAASAAAHGIDFDVAAELTDDDLAAIGFTIGDRKRFARAIAEHNQADPARSVAPGPVASVERRSLSVLFCDLVGSTVLVNRMDGEEYAELVAAFSRACRDAITTAGGTVAKYTGDGAIAYFGYPVSRSDDAARAIRAGLAIQAAVTELDERDTVDLRARVGIASGLTIVGNVLGDDEDAIVDVVGDIPTLASRVESNAAVGSVTVSDLTRRLAGDAFEFEDLGPVALKGFSEHQRLHRVERPHDETISFGAGAPPIVGRTHELAALHEELACARRGDPRSVTIVGEPGVGKSTLARTFAASARADGWMVLHFACWDQNQAVQAHPLRRAIVTAAQLRLGDNAALRVAKLHALADRLDIIGAAIVLVGMFGETGSAAMSPSERRAVLFDGVADAVRHTTAAHPLLIVVEDIHWADATTIALIDHVLAQAAGLPVLLLLTSRPADVPAGSPIPAATGPGRTIDLSPLTFVDSDALVELAAGGPVDPRIVASILERGDGLPLFIEEITRSLIERGALAVVDGVFTTDHLDADLIPETLHHSLAARLDRLPNGGRLAPLAAALGRSFPPDLLREVALGVDVGVGLHELIDAQLVDPGSDGNLSFRHALICDAAYERMVRSERRAVHQRAAHALIERFADTAESAPHLVAHHLERSEDPQRAVPYWLRAAELAAQQSANSEVVAAADTALAILALLTEHADEQRRLELDLQLLRAGALRGVAGFAAPMTGAAYTRARELCELTGDDERLFTTLNGLYSFHLVRDEYDLAADAARDLLTRAERSGRPRDAMIANRAAGAVAFHTGRLADADMYLRRSIETYRAGDFAADRFIYGTDHACTASAFLALAQWVSGRPRAALATSDWAIVHARELDHPHSWAQALTYRCFLSAIDRDWSAVVERGDALLELAEGSRLAMMAVTARFWVASGSFFLGDRAAIDEMLAMSQAWWDTGGRSYVCFRNTLLAEAYGELHQPDAGLELIAGGLERVAATNERWSEAEALRVRGRLLAQLGAQHAAGVAIAAAAAVAAAQGATLWALRTEIERYRLGGRADTLRGLMAELGDDVCIDVRDAARLVG